MDQLLDRHRYVRMLASTIVLLCPWLTIHSSLVLRRRRRRRAAVHDRRARDRRLRAGRACARPTAPRRRCARRRPRRRRPSRRSSPRPGGVRREYWIQAETVRWAITPKRKRRVAQPPGRRPQRLHRVRLPPDDAGLRRLPIGHPTIPGPTLRPRSATSSSCTSATPTAGSTRRSRCTRTASSTTRSTTAPTWASSRARAASSRPARRSRTSGSARRTRSAIWPYHDHGPNHTLNTFRGLFGAVIVRPKGAKRPDRTYTLFAHQLPPPVTRLERTFHCFNGRAYAGNTPTLTARVGEDVEIHGDRHGLELPHVPHPRPPLARSGGGLHRQPGVRAERDRHGPLRRGQPGPLALPLPRLHAPGRRHGGLVRGRTL